MNKALKLKTERTTNREEGGSETEGRCNEKDGDGRKGRFVARKPLEDSLFPPHCYI